MSGISGNYNYPCAGGTYNREGVGSAGSAGSASGAGSAGSTGSSGSAGSFGSTVTGSATGSFGDMLDDITANLAWENISTGGVGLYSMDESGIFGCSDLDDPFEPSYYNPDGSSNQGIADAPFTNTGYEEHRIEKWNNK